MKIISALVLVVLLSSCKLENDFVDTSPEIVDFTAQNEQDITDYLTANNLVAQRSSTGLHYIIENQGDGEQPTTNSTVTVAYKGYFINGSTFDQSDENGITFGLQQVIPGWTEGMTYFNEGGNGVLLIPAHLGYGSNPPAGIPLGAVLLFDVNLVSIN